MASATAASRSLLTFSRSAWLRDADFFSRHNRIRWIHDNGFILAKPGDNLDLGTEIMDTRDRLKVGVPSIGYHSAAKPLRPEQQRVYRENECCGRSWKLQMHHGISSAEQCARRIIHSNLDQ